MLRESSRSFEKCSRIRPQAKTAGNHTKAAAAAPARLDLDGEYPLEALRPRQGQGPLPIGDGGFAALTGHGGARSGHHPGPIRARRREHAVVADLMRAGLRHECGKSRDRILGLEKLTVYADNEPAIRLYEKFGFCVEGRFARYALRDGRYVDALPMARLKWG